MAGGELEALVRRWDELLVAEKRWGEYWPVTETGTVLRASASEDEVAALEARLCVELPPSYRAFLAISNGAWAKPGWGVVGLREPSMRAPEAGAALDALARSPSASLQRLAQLWS